MATDANVSRSQIAFIVSEDWFFASHFLPLLRAARDAGLRPIVIAREHNHRGIIEQAGGRLIALNVERRSLNPLAFAFAVLRLARILRSEKIDFVHCIALRSILLGALAASLAGVHPRFLAVTGGGFMSANKSALTRVPAHILRFFISKVITNSRTLFVFENVTDPLDYGLQPTASNVTILGGAGVDPEYFVPSPLPQSSELRIAMVSRMLWSKGADTLVKAVELARANGCDVRLSLYGVPDPSNPRAISIETLKEWSHHEGIEWNGPIKDVREVWKTHHVASLPSRGGEGLPRTILEAAACGRCLLVTDVPGCRDFVRDGLEGWLVPVGDAQHLAELIHMLFNDRERVRIAGQKARERVLAGFTEDHIVQKIKALYAASRLSK